MDAAGTPLTSYSAGTLACHTTGGGSCERADCIMDSPTTGPGFKTRLVRYFLSSFLLTTVIQESVERSPGLWNVGEGFPGRVLPRTLKWVAVYSGVTFHING